MPWEKKSKDNLPLTGSLIYYFFRFNILLFLRCPHLFQGKKFLILASCVGYCNIPGLIKNGFTARLLYLFSLQ